MGRKGGEGVGEDVRKKEEEPGRTVVSLGSYLRRFGLGNEGGRCVSRGLRTTFVRCLLSLLACCPFFSVCSRYVLFLKRSDADAMYHSFLNCSLLLRPDAFETDRTAKRKWKVAFFWRLDFLIRCQRVDKMEAYTGSTTYSCRTALTPYRSVSY